MNKIYYIANNRFPTERAHGIQIAETCQAFQRISTDVVLLVPNRRTSVQEDAFSYYGLQDRFVIKKLFTIDFLDILPNRATFILQSLTFSLSTLFFVFKNLEKNDFIYSRDQFSLFLLNLFSKKNLFYEMHNFPKKLNIFHKILFPKLKFIVISHGLRKELAKINIDESKILVAPDGINFLQSQKYLKNKKEIRIFFDLPLDQKIILYTGQMYSWKGVDLLLSVARELKQYLFLFVGGSDKDLAILKEKHFDDKNIIFWGQKKHADILALLPAADALVLPNSAKEKISSDYTSPMKLFEYMAAKVPIIASDLSSIREIVDEKMVLFFHPDQKESLKFAIEKIFSDDDLAQGLAGQSLSRAKDFDWQVRAKNIINFLKNA